jgi:DNA-binding transcriptional MerR regulator
MDQEHFYTSPLINLLTMNDIARELGVSLETVKSILEKQRIAPTRRVGVVRLWDRRTVAALRERLRG